MKSKKLISPSNLDTEKLVKQCEMVTPFTIEPLSIDPYTIEEKLEKSNITDNELPKYPFTNKEKKEENAINEEISEEAKIICKNSRKKENSKHIKPTESFFIANYHLTPIEKHVFINRKGKEIAERECIRTKVQINGELPKELEIKTAEIRNVAKIMGDTFSTAIVSEDSKAPKIVENDFRKKTSLIPVVRFFVQAGWQMIDGKRTYASDTCVETKSIKFQTGLSLPVSTDINICEVFQRALQLYTDKAVIATMFLYAFTGVMYKVFEEAGYPPRFLLFLNGKSGTMKTTIGRILYTQLCRPEHRNHVRRIDADTAASFERGIIEAGADTVLLFDDYAPAKTRSQKAEMDKKVEVLIRMVGDGSTKSRSNVDLEDIQGEGVHGTIVLTGELRSKGLSTNLRCLYCKFEHGKANTDEVTWFQKNDEAFCSLIARFTDFLSVNWEYAVTYIKEHFEEKRSKLNREITEKRIIDSVCILHIIADILEKFAIEYCRFDPQYTKNLFIEMRDAVIINAKYSQILSKEEIPAIMFARAIGDLINQGQLKLCEKSEFEMTNDYDGFWDEKNYFFIPSNLYDKTLHMLGMMHMYFPLDMQETVAALKEEGFIKEHSNGKNKKTNYARILIGNTRIKFLQFPRDVFVELMEKES